MNNCKTCVYRIFDPLWGVYKCRLKKMEIKDVDTIDCDEYKKGNPPNYVAPENPKPTPKPTPKPPTSSTPGSCDSCIYYTYDRIWAVHKCRLKRIELQNGIVTDCHEYKKGCPKGYVAPKEPKPGPPGFISITENGTYKSSEDGIIGYNEIEVKVPTVVQTNEPYDGKYEVKPRILGQTLPTKDKVMTDHLKVLAIPYYETSNHKNGTTVIIGDDTIGGKLKYKTELEYLEGTGTQWIDTGYKISNKSEIELVINLLGSNSCDVFGCRASKSNANLKNVSVTTGTSSLIVVDFTNSNYAPYRSSITSDNNCKAKIVINKNERSVTNLDSGTVLASNKTVCNDVFVCDTNAYLLHVSGQAFFAKATEKAKLYSLKIAESGKLVRDFVPVLDWNDVPCMYDKVTDELFYNQGTGNFGYV